MNFSFKRHLFTSVVLVGILFVGIFAMQPKQASAGGNPNAFITTWETDNPGTSANNQITIPTASGSFSYNYDVDWGDGNTDSGVTGDITHTYLTPGSYQVTITGTFPAIEFGDGGDAQKITEINQWGTGHWLDVSGAFFGCVNLHISATDAPDLSGVDDMTYMFRGTGLTNEDLSSWNVNSIKVMIGVFQGTNFNGNISTWDTSNVTNLAGLFYSDPVFDGNISTWNTSNVISMSAMFEGDVAFNQDLHSWDVSKVQDMSSMFQGDSSFNGSLTWGGKTSNVTNMETMFAGASAFNQDISGWDTSSVTNMEGMFNGATAFNQPIGAWDVSHVTNMQQMFLEDHAFDQDLSTWNTSNVTTMNAMFMHDYAFNHPIDSWNISNVTDLGSMFYEDPIFNQPLDSWNTSNVVSLGAMFDGDTDFNQPLNDWDVSKVTYFGNLFESSAFNQPLNHWNTASLTDIYATFSLDHNFNQDISSWNTSKVTNMLDTFAGDPSFDQNLSTWNVSHVTDMTDMFGGGALSTANYDAILAAWSLQSLQSNVTFDAGNSLYCSSVAQRNNIISSYHWTIYDGGIAPGACPPPAPTQSGTVAISGGGAVYICTDSKASNYQASFGISKPSVCVYGTNASNVSITSNSPVSTATSSVAAVVPSTHLQAPSPRTLKLGMSGLDVKALQVYLNAHHFTVTVSGKETNYFGLKTKSAVMQFQKSHNLKADGTVGPQTRALME